MLARIALQRQTRVRLGLVVLTLQLCVIASSSKRGLVREARDQYVSSRLWAMKAVLAYIMRDDLKATSGLYSSYLQIDSG